jgi:hypothetical protein
MGRRLPVAFAGIGQALPSRGRMINVRLGPALPPLAPISPGSLKFPTRPSVVWR